MTWPLLRRIWVTVTNLAFLAFLVAELVQDYEIRHLQGASRPTGTFLETSGPFVPVLILIIGIGLEWFGRLRPALIVNVGFWGLLGVGILGAYLWWLMTKSPHLHDPEAALVLSIVAIPCAVISIADFLLYWKTRRAKRDDAPVRMNLA